MSNEPSKRSLDAMHEVLLDDGGLAPWTTALAADRLVADAVQAERQRILARFSVIVKASWGTSKWGEINAIVNDIPIVEADTDE